MPLLTLVAELSPAWGAVLLSALGWRWAKSIHAHAHDTIDPPIG